MSCTCDADDVGMIVVQLYCVMSLSQPSGAGGEDQLPRPNTSRDYRDDHNQGGEWNREEV